MEGITNVFTRQGTDISTICGKKLNAHTRRVGGLRSIMQVDKSKKFNFLYSSQVHVLLSLPQDAEFLTICAYYNLREITFSKQNITLLHAVRTNQVFSIKKVLLRQPVP